MPLSLQIRRCLVQPRRFVGFVLAVARLLYIQIRRWPMQTEVWRFVGSVSAVAGLLCYALSSSFNHLFGHWNSLKIFLYFIFSFIILFTTLFAKVWQCSTSTLFKTRMAVLVLIATALYSFFYDVAVKGKPDAYILISCVAFAVMSLSLSKQTQYGYERDLLNFFLGCLIIQLMKIHLWLFFVGAGFSYSLILSRPSLDVTPQSEFSEDHMVIQVEHLEEANSNSVIQVDTQQVDTDSAIQMDSLKVNNILIMPQFKAFPVTDYDIALPSGTINDLHEIAKRMVVGGFGKECSHVYSSCRREFLEESLSRLGLQKLSVEEVHKKTWQELEDEIEIWIKASNVALRILFPSERRLCDRVFFGFSSAADLSFMEVCRGSAIQLLNFADAVAIGSRSPERLFKILDVFETLRDLIPEFESLFSDQYSVLLRNEAITIWKRLGESIRGIFMELENLIRRDPAEVAVPGGGLHPITRYVMNYLHFACRSRISLEQVFEEYPKLDDKVASTSSLSMQMDWIVELLESNLEAKSKIYKDTTLSYVFLMNNGRYIVQKAKDSELGSLLGDDWIRKLAARVRQYHVHYQRSSWNKVLGILKLDNSNKSVGANGVAKTIKEKIKLFNVQFDEICKVQCSWFVFDEQLREEIRISVEKILLPAYGNFIARFRSVPELGKHADKYIKYGTEDIEAKINDLFQGSSGSNDSRK